MDKRSDLEERIRNGEAYLATLQPNDSKYEPVKMRINKLREELNKLSNVATSGHFHLNLATTLGSEGNRQTSTVCPTIGQSNAQTSAHLPLPHWIDPRPDLKEDTALWTALLELAHEYDDEICAVLNGFRCGGTRLKFGESRWVLRPDIDPTGRIAWESQAAYDEMKEKYLKEWFGVLGAMLDELTKRWPYKPAEQLVVKKEQPIQMSMGF